MIRYNFIRETVTLEMEDRREVEFFSGRVGHRRGETGGAARAGFRGLKGFNLPAIKLQI